MGEPAASKEVWKQEKSGERASGLDWLARGVGGEVSVTWLCYLYRLGMGPRGRGLEEGDQNVRTPEF